MADEPAWPARLHFPTSQPCGKIEVPLASIQMKRGKSKIEKAKVAPGLARMTGLPDDPAQAGSARSPSFSAVLLRFRDEVRAILADEKGRECRPDYRSSAGL